MADTTVVREVKGRLRLDTTDLDRASSATQKFGKDVQTHVGGSSVHTLRAEQAFTTLIDRIEGMPPAVNQAARSLESIHSEGGAVISALGGVGTIATIAGAAVLAFATESTKHYMELAEQVINYRRVTGDSAEESSRMVEVANVLGVSSDSLSNAMFRLNQRITTSSAATKGHAVNLKSLGIEIAHTDAGAVDLHGTLGNIADAYVAAGSGAEKDQILFAAFGRSGRDLIPILEQGSAGLKRLEAGANNVFTEQQLEQVHRYKIETAQLAKEQETLGNTIGSNTVPILLALTQSLNDNYEATRRLDQQQQSNISTQREQQYGAAASVRGHADLRRATINTIDAEKEQKQALENATAAIKAQADQMKAQEDELNKVYDAVHKNIDANFAYEQAEINITKAAKAVDDAHQKAADAVARYGANSDEARDAALNETETVLQQKEAMVKLADAAVELAVQQASVAGQTLNAQQKADIFKTKLQDLTNVVGPNSALGQALQGYISQLANIPPSITTTLHLDLPPSVDVGFTQRAGGGTVVPNRVYTVGEQGPETLVMNDRGGYVIPHGGGGSSTGGPTPAGGGDTYNIQVSGSDADPWRIAQEIAWMRKTA